MKTQSATPRLRRFGNKNETLSVHRPTALGQQRGFIKPAWRRTLPEANSAAVAQAQLTYPG
jgi:hypothetical protein